MSFFCSRNRRIFCQTPIGWMYLLSHLALIGFIYGTWWLIPLGGLVHPNYKWINPLLIPCFYHWGELTHKNEPWVVRHQVGQCTWNGHWMPLRSSQQFLWGLIRNHQLVKMNGKLPRNLAQYIRINGNFRILKWMYLPYIRPFFQAYVSEYHHKIWPKIWY